MSKFAVVVPTMNAGATWQIWLEALSAQTLQPNIVLILDSESTDATASTASKAGCHLVGVPRQNFDHGATRQSALIHIPENTEILVYLTQDAVLANRDALARIIAPFEDKSVGVAYGRQLPRPNAKPIEAHARIFNYPPQSYVRSLEDKKKFGIKAAFSSDSFSAYRKTALLEVGGFPTPILASEDLITAAKMLKAGFKICYAADAMVYHSHEYTIPAELRRYFDIGANHRRNPWLLAEFGTPEGDGAKFVKSELNYLRARAPHLMPLALMKTAAKYAGYRLGRLDKHLPLPIKRHLSMNKGYWQKPEAEYALKTHSPQKTQKTPS